LVENLRFRRFLRTLISFEVPPWDLGMEVCLKKLRCLGYTVVETAWWCDHRYQRVTDRLTEGYTDRQKNTPSVAQSRYSGDRAMLRVI